MSVEEVLEIIDKVLDSERLNKVQELVFRQSWEGAIVVMDNLRVHHAECIGVAIESVGAFIKFLPPFSLDLSPIKLCCRNLRNFSVPVRHVPMNHVNLTMAEAVNYITEDDAFAWFNYCSLLSENCSKKI